MKSRTLKIIASCVALISCTADANDEQSKEPTFENFQQIQSIIRNVFCSEAEHNDIRKELLEISDGDQADRITPTPEMTPNDTKRRVRVAAIAAKGCLKDQDDYFTAAVVFQHGILPEHYLQAVIYSNKSVELGHSGAGQLRELTVDRYLMSLGYKQIFGSQITAPAAYKEYENEEDTLPCLWPIEDGIDMVEDYDFGTKEYWISRGDNIAAKKQQVPECDFPARDSSAMLSALLNTKI